MPVDQKQCRVVFEKLDHQLTKVAHKLDPASVHKFRTYSRRAEALLGCLVPESSRKDRKLLKLLARLRKKAGRIRDLDVQMSNLRSLKITREGGEKSHLQRALAQERGKQEKKLTESLSKVKLRELRKRLKRAAKDLEIPESTTPLSVTMREFAQLGQSNGPLTEKTLHQYRIAGKRARYLAEFAGKDPDAERMIKQLKDMQDVIGDWHDWLKLTERAEALFGGVRNSPLVAALRNLTRAKFRQSVDAVIKMRSSIVGKRDAKPTTVPNRKPPAQLASRLNESVA